LSLQFTLDENFAALVIDRTADQCIGTAFAFLQPYWAVTAKHVVMQNCALRENLGLLFKKGTCSCSLLYAHPTIDLAVLLVAGCPCNIPLFPAHHKFAGAGGLVTVGYRPSKNTKEYGRTIEVNHVATFDTEQRDRPDGREELVIFQADFAEGGHSGGPVLGVGGGVVGVVIEYFDSGKGWRVRATAIEPLLRKLTFA
jgi:Trypsin-like peptidase domain